MPAVVQWLPFVPQFEDANGQPLTGAQLFFYAAGTTTKLSTYTTSAGNVANANPMILDASGRPQQAIWLISGSLYKVGLAASTEPDPPNNFIWTIDQVSGTPSSVVTATEWVASGFTPTYISATSFTVPGDQTSTLQVGRALQILDAGGTKYGYIKTSAFTTLTTVTLDQNSQALSSPVSSVAYGFLSATNPSMPILVDTLPLRTGAADESKQFRLEIDTNVPPATTRVGTVPALDGTLALTTDFNGYPVLRDYISGFTLTTASISTYDIAAGAGADSTNTSWLNGSAITAKSQSAWAAGSSAGGKLSAAAMANNTWYYWYALWKTVDGSVDYGFDVSSTTPTLPTGYTKWRYIGARKTSSGSTNWDTFIQHGDYVEWSTPPALDFNSNATTGSRTAQVVNVPAVRVEWVGNVQASVTGTQTQILIFTDPATADVAPGNTASPLGNIGFGQASGVLQTNVQQVRCWTNTSSVVGVRGTLAGGIQIQTIGFVDPRGKPV